MLLSTFERGHGILFEQTLIPFTQGYFVPDLVEIAPVVMDKNILIFHNVSSLLYCYLPLEKGMAPHLYKLEFPSPKDVFCLVG